VTEAIILTGTDGRPLAAKGQRTRARLLETAERVFAELGYNDASIVKITEAAGVGQGTFYLYFSGKSEIFEELVRDLNHRVRRAMTEAAEQGGNRIEAELLGFRAFFRFTAEHPALYRIIRQAEFASPDTLQFHYDRIVEGYVGALERAMDVGEIERRDPEVLAWALMGIGELIGMRYILWAKRNDVSEHVIEEIERIISCLLEPRGKGHRA
jgi:AcrR family transcriptional regulator